MNTNRKSFPPGYRFRLEGNPSADVIDFGIPSMVVIPLKQGFDEEVNAVVEPGDKVRAGQVIGRGDQSSASSVHASVSGVVESVAKIKYAGADVNAVVIKSDGTATWESLEASSNNWESLSVSQVEELLYASGVASLDRYGLLSRDSEAGDDGRHLIIKGVEANPYNISLTALVAEQGLSRFVEGLKILQRIMPGAKIHLAFGESERELIKELSEVKGDLESLTIYTLPSKYPLDNEEVLVSAILGSNATKGWADKVVVLSAQTVFHARDAVVDGKPLIERIVALSGPGWENNFHLRVRIGTPLEFIVGEYLKKTGRQRLVPNNLLTNLAFTDYALPVDCTIDNLNAIPENDSPTLFSFLHPGAKANSNSKTFLSALRPNTERSCDTSVRGESGMCISCGYCEDVCPAGIIPHYLDKHVQQNIIDLQLIRYGVFNCVECNLCSFVCPSRIHLGWNIKEAKRKLAEDFNEIASDAVIRKFSHFHFGG